MQISVKAARVNSGLSQKETAEMIGISLRSYVAKENGNRKFYADEIAQLSAIFQVPMQNFFEVSYRNKTHSAS